MLSTPPAMTTSASPIQTRIDRVGDSFEARAAEAVHRERGDLVRQAREKRGHARDVAIVLTRLIGRAEDDVIDTWREAGRTLDERVHDVGGKIVGANSCQGPAITRDGRADRVDEVGRTERAHRVHCATPSLQR
jgi:hypothetical protein